MRKNKPKIGIIDLESNNLYSIYNSCLISGFKPKIISPKEKSFNYDLVIMPGVGAFKTGMRVLKKYHYDDKILNYLNKPNAFLYGICLGMQLLFSSSQELKNFPNKTILKQIWVGQKFQYNRKSCY